RAVADVVDDVLAGGPKPLSGFRERIMANRTSNGTRFARFKKDVAASIKRHRWYVATGSVALGIGIGAFAVAALVLFLVARDGWRGAAPRWSDVVLVALGGCAAANAVVLLAALRKVRLWRRRSQAGETEAERWDAFRRYLTDFPRLQDAPPA